MRDDEIPKYFKKPGPKRFGIRWSRARTSWYATEKARDQAFDDLKKHTSYWLKVLGLTRNFTKVER